MSDRIILHSDLNNFYASVECLYNPALRDKPVAVGGDAEKRHGIVLAKNYEAKKYGIQTGETLWQARRKCPNIVFVPPSYDLYLKYSRIAREIYSEYTDRVESFGLDECWLDVTGSAHLFGGGENIAGKIRERIKSELGVTASIGVSYNKIFAKLGSDMKKPDATTVITRENYQDTVWPLPASDLLFIGQATYTKLKRYGYNTIGRLANADPHLLKTFLGKNGVMLWQFANGLDLSPVSSADEKVLIKSIGNSTTAPRDLISDQDIKITLLTLCESVAARLREQDFTCSTVQISIRDNQLASYTRQGGLLYPSCLCNEIFEKAYALYRANRPDRPVRSIGVRACRLTHRTSLQLSFLPELVKRQEQERLERTIDALRSRFGFFALQRGVALMDKALSNLDAKSEHIIFPESFLR